MAIYFRYNDKFVDKVTNYSGFSPQLGLILIFNISNSKTIKKVPFRENAISSLVFLRAIAHFLFVGLKLKIQT